MTNSINLSYYHEHLPTVERIAGGTPLNVRKTTTKSGEKSFDATIANYDYSIVKSAHGMDAPEKDEALIELSKFCAYSVLKKIYKKSAQPVIADLIRSITADLADIDRLEYSIEHATVERVTYNRDGDEIDSTEIIDHDCHKAVVDLVKTAHGDGLDIVNTAVVAIMEETNKAIERDGDRLAFGWFEKSYNKRVLRQHVLIKDADAVGAWTDKETTPIQEVYKTIRRYIESTRQIQTANDKYTYLDAEVIDEKTGERDTIYRRLPKYSNLAGEPVDANENILTPKETKPQSYITADSQTVTEYYDIVSRLELNDRQAKVLQYRMSGYGTTAIGTALGIQERIVRRIMQQIAVKLFDIGVHPASVTERPTVK